MLYEQRKHDGTLPIVGVNTFLAPDGSHDEAHDPLELARGTEEKQSQLRRLPDFHTRHADSAPAALEHLKDAAASGGNTFAALMDAVRLCSLGQITKAFFEGGGAYRRTV
jgi:methylmalonyl-CoA mutase